MTFSPKNITYSKDGATITCPVCQKTATYQIGQLDREEWVLVRGKYKCSDCRAIPMPTPIFAMAREQDDIDKLLEML